MSAILLADEDETRRAALTGRLHALGHRVVAFLSADLLRAHTLHRPDLTVMAAATGADAAIARIAELRKHDPAATVLLIVGGGSEALAVAALRAGVKDYLPEPALVEHVLPAIERCLAAAEPIAPATDRAAAAFVGASAEMREVQNRLQRVAAHNTTVLITGETGTGKELAAGLLHRGSPRRDRHFVPINCAAIPDTLLESELFGYERGAFTGATATRAGLLQQAQGGTVFLDEIGEMSPSGQAKLLRAVEAREIVPVGGRTPVPVDVRIVAATNQDLDQAVANRTFRKDLYYRLNVVRIHLPPLRQRASDVPSLLNHFLDHASRRADSRARFTDEAMALLQAYPWPGNVRELKNLVDAVVAEGTPFPLGARDLPARITSQASVTSIGGADRERLLDALVQARWNKSRAARQLHCSRMTLYRWMAREKLTKTSD